MRVYPGGPKCNYNGKLVDHLTYILESGGITGDILIEILKYFVETDLFPRLPGGIIPALIVDGHQSRLDPKFVEYINDVGHHWKVCLGVPYAITLWQVGDASEKMEWLSRSGIVKNQNLCFGRMNTAYHVQSVQRMLCPS